MPRKKRSNKRTNNKKNEFLTIIVTIIVAIIGMYISSKEIKEDTNIQIPTVSYDISSIPEYNNEPYVIINENKPNFEEQYFTENCFELYSELDEYGRCGVAFANLGKETMPAEGEERTSISDVYPSGWKNRRYDSSLVNGGYLYNRCHLIAHSLSAENANNKNLITGTKYFNVNGMLPFETMILKYLRANEDKHVLYRVTPVYEERNLVASGVIMEAESVEDKGQSICFNVYVYNVQPGIEINYSNGENKLKQ